MNYYIAKNNVKIRLTEERWIHIITRHPEMKNQKEKVFKTITDPELIQKGDYGELLAIRYFPKTPLTHKYLVVIYKEINKYDGFVLTAYFTTSYSKGRVIKWKL